jgi:hypothetical protein
MWRSHYIWWAGARPDRTLIEASLESGHPPAEIFARMGADIPRSTLIDWCGQAVATRRPLTDLIRAEVMRSNRLHADDTLIRVLDPRRRG